MSNNIMANSNIWSNTGTDGPTSTTTDRLTSDKNTFLKLLVAQLSNQDPLNPTEDKEFVSQLAQFTSLEQLQSINTGVETLNSTIHDGQMMTATGFIGKDVMVTGNQITKLNNAEGDILTTTVYYTLDDPVAKHQITVRDKTTGMPVYTEELGARQAGSYPYIWEGKDDDGREVASGAYDIYITAQDANDKPALVKTQFAARVLTVMNEDGVYKLTLDGGRTVNLMDVTEVGGADTNANSTVSYAGYAADYAAAAKIAMNTAEGLVAKVEAAETADNAKTHANAAIAQGNAAKTAAENADKVVTQARTYSEEAKTNDSLEDLAKAEEWAATAHEYAEKAKEFADVAKAAAEAKGAKWEDEKK